MNMVDDYITLRKQLQGNFKNIYDEVSFEIYSCIREACKYGEEYPFYVFNLGSFILKLHTHVHCRYVSVIFSQVKNVIDDED